MHAAPYSVHTVQLVVHSCEKRVDPTEPNIQGIVHSYAGVLVQLLRQDNGPCLYSKKVYHKKTAVDTYCMAVADQLLFNGRCGLATYLGTIVAHWRMAPVAHAAPLTHTLKPPELQTHLYEVCVICPETESPGIPHRLHTDVSAVQ